MCNMTRELRDTTGRKRGAGGQETTMGLMHAAFSDFGGKSKSKDGKVEHRKI